MSAVCPRCGEGQALYSVSAVMALSPYSSSETTGGIVSSSGDFTPVFGRTTYTDENLKALQQVIGKWISESDPRVKKQFKHLLTWVGITIGSAALGISVQVLANSQIANLMKQNCAPDMWGQYTDCPTGFSAGIWETLSHITLPTMGIVFTFSLLYGFIGSFRAAKAPLKPEVQKELDAKKNGFYCARCQAPFPRV